MGTATANLYPDGWHAYRRGLASNLKTLGVDDTVIQRILRHDDVRTPQKYYIRVRDDKMHDAMQRLNQAIGEADGTSVNAGTAFVQPDDESSVVN